jgi:hypothetical protein
MGKDEGTQSGPNRYCLGCAYPLDWLPETRCPECGRLFDPENPGTFARSPRKPWLSAFLSTRRGRIAAALAVLAVVFIVVEAKIEVGYRLESCTQCGAGSTVRHLVLFGLGGDYGRQTIEGPLSSFIQESGGTKCLHQWKGYSFRGGGLIFGWLGCGDSLYAIVRCLDSLPPQFAGLLHSKADQDSQFVTTLRAAIQGGAYENSREFLTQLEFEGKMWCAQHSR